MQNIKCLSILILVLMLSACSASSNEGTNVETTATSDYSADQSKVNAILVDGETQNLDNITVTKSGDGDSDDDDFYGYNAAVLATNGANLTITNADINTNGKYANGVFSYGEGTIVTISDSTIKTSQRNSGGIMVTGGGTLYANNLTIETEGGSSAAIRSDKGGGTLVVDGGTYTTNGSGSPAIYSTADISVSNATLTSTSAEGVVVEGGNSVSLTNCSLTANNTVLNSDKSDYYQAVMLYQSMSGDASEGSGTFSMSDGSLTSLNGGMFFVTNATYSINLNNVDLTYASDDFLRVCAAGWGNDGSNGGQVTLNLTKQNIEGIITIDEISKLNMYLKDNSSFTGSFDNDGEVYVEIEEGSTWTLTQDCEITSLTCSEDAINLNGYTLTVNGVKYSQGSACSGEAIEFTTNTMNNNDRPEMPDQKDENSGQHTNQMNNEETPPEKPDGEKNNENGEPPEKPDGEKNEGGEPPIAK